MTDTPTETIIPPAPAEPLPSFDTVDKGFHPAQVQRYITSLWAHIESLEHRLVPAAEHAAADLARSPQAQQLVEDLMKIGLDEISGQRAKAAEDAAKLLSDARGEAAAIMGQAREEADKIVAGAREQSERVLTDARSKAKQMTDQAAAKSAAVNEAADVRMQAVADAHQKTLSRIRAINDVTSRLLDAEESRGSIEGEVDRAVKPAQVTAKAPAELTASAG